MAWKKKVILVSLATLPARILVFFFPGNLTPRGKTLPSQWVRIKSSQIAWRVSLCKPRLQVGAGHLALPSCLFVGAFPYLSWYHNSCWDLENLGLCFPRNVNHLRMLLLTQTFLFTWWRLNSRTTDGKSSWMDVVHLPVISLILGLNQFSKWQGKPGDHSRLWVAFTTSQRRLATVMLFEGTR